LEAEEDVGGEIGQAGFVVVAGVGLGGCCEERERHKGGGGFFHLDPGVFSTRGAGLERAWGALFTILIGNAIYLGRYRVFFTV
jgi:hypothetical protein